MGVFNKKTNSFACAPEVLPPPPEEEQHVSRKLKELMHLRKTLQQMGNVVSAAQQRPVRRQKLGTPQRRIEPLVRDSVAMQAPPQQQSKPPPEQPQQLTRTKAPKYLSRKQRLKKARREEARQNMADRQAPLLPSFNEVAPAPPHLNLNSLKRPTTHEASPGNRLGRLFEQQMQHAVVLQQGRTARESAESHSRDQLRAEMIAKYRQLRGTQLAAALPPIRPT